ncbi:MAG: ATP-binding protein, partial [Alistipes sp.]|nr:ATP-binding protein [Alistipes sp.]
RYPSQAKAANSLKGTSAGTVNAILKGKFENISDEMFCNIRSQIESSKVDGWQLCGTAAFKDVNTFLEDAQQYQNVSWIVGPAGIGKTTAATIYARGHKNVFYLPCSEDMHKSDFVRELARKIGIRTEGLTVRETLAAITAELVTLDHPLLIFDEGDKLTDSVMYYYISLYNALEDKCGMVFLSTPYIIMRMQRGVDKDRKGYAEMYSRICRKFVTLTKVTEFEVRAICIANGLTADENINMVVADAKLADFDIRRVKKEIHKQLRILAASRL